MPLINVVGDGLVFIDELLNVVRQVMMERLSKKTFCKFFCANLTSLFVAHESRSSSCLTPMEVSKNNDII